MNRNRYLAAKWQDTEALRRYQLIAPLLQEDLDEGARLKLRKEIADREQISVRTLYRYESAYRDHEFSGLRPADRTDHRSGRLPDNWDEILQQAIQLRKEVPERSVAQIIYILEMEKIAVPGSIKRSTLERHLYKAGFGSEHLRTYREARNSSSKRFCKPHRIVKITNIYRPFSR